jgi:hypothetical protein
MSKVHLYPLQTNILLRIYLLIGSISVSTLAKLWLQPRLGSEISNRGEELTLETTIETAVVLGRGSPLRAHYLCF